MRSTWIAVFAPLALLSLTPPSPGGWGGGTCGPVGPTRSFASAPHFTPDYAPAAPAPAPIALPAGKNPGCPCSGACACGCQDGGDCPCSGYKAPAVKPAAVKPPPESLPGDELAAAPNYGLGPRYEFATTETITVNGREVSKAAALEMLEGPASPDSELPDDAKKPWLVAVAPDAAGRDAARLDLAKLANSLRVVCLKAGDWQCSDRTGKPVYLPGLTLCDAAGKPVHHQQGLTIGRLRKVPDGFDPAAIPDLMRPEAAPTPPATPAPAGGIDYRILWLPAGLAALALIFRPRKP